MKRKINIGAGLNWQEESWEVLDNVPGKFNESWKHYGKAWDSKLESNTYDIVFTSHVLEHIPHFRIEKTIAEFNRIMKTGGTIRILVPNLKKYATAYINNDKEYFSSEHNSDHLGIGGSFVRKILSPGSQSILISREMDEIFGGYAHIYSYDFEMMKRLLEKWGFGNIKESEPGESSIEELKVFQYIYQNGNVYDKESSFVVNKEYLAVDSSWHYGGFDKRSKKQLALEAQKVSNEIYEYEKEFNFNKNSRFQDPLDKVKLYVFRLVSKTIDITYEFFNLIGFIAVLKFIKKRI